MKITKIDAQVKTKGRYSIFVDGKFAFGLSELGLINSGIKIGQELTGPELEDYKKSAKTDKIYNMCLGLIARRPRSQWEIIDYLKRKGCEEECTRNVLVQLGRGGFINDLDFARRWVESRRLLKSTSKRKLSTELRQKRISDEIIQHVLKEDETDEMDVLKVLAYKKSQQSAYKDKQKLMAYLMRQGFNYEDIKNALSALQS